MHHIGFKTVLRWYIRWWRVSKQVLCFILTMFVLKPYPNAIRGSSFIEIKEAEGGRIKSYMT